jgi:hypothetical protein
MTNDINNRSRRGFLKGAALAGASGAAVAIAPTAAQSTLASAPARAVGRPNSRTVAVETANPADASQSKSTHAPGADFIADVIKSLKFDYIGESRRQLSRATRIADQLRQQQTARVSHLHARRVLCWHGARLLQDCGPSYPSTFARNCWPATRQHGNLQCLVRSRACCDNRRESFGRIAAPAGRADISCGTGSQFDR